MIGVFKTNEKVFPSGALVAVGCDEIDCTVPNGVVLEDDQVSFGTSLLKESRSPKLYNTGRRLGMSSLQSCHPIL